MEQISVILHGICEAKKHVALKMSLFSVSISFTTHFVQFFNETWAAVDNILWRVFST